MKRGVHACAREHRSRRCESDAGEPAVEGSSRSSSGGREIRHRTQLFRAVKCHPDRGGDGSRQGVPWRSDRCHHVSGFTRGGRSPNLGRECIGRVVDATNHDVGRAKLDERLDGTHGARRNGQVSDDRDGCDALHRDTKSGQPVGREVITIGAGIDDRHVALPVAQSGDTRVPCGRVVDVVRWRKRALDLRQRVRREVAVNDHVRGGRRHAECTAAGSRSPHHSVACRTESALEGG